MSQRKRERIRETILARSGSNVIPTAASISREMGRNTRTLNGQESAYRREVLFDLDNDIPQIPTGVETETLGTPVEPLEDTADSE